MQPTQPPPSPHLCIRSQSPTEQFHTFSTQIPHSHQLSQSQTQGQQNQQAAGQPQQQPVFITSLYQIQGSDGYVAAPPAGFSTTPSGPPHQGPSAVLRGMQSTAPPTPPQQQDLNKMQQPPQQMFVPAAGSNTSGNVRPTQQANIYRGASTSTTARAPRHNLATIPPHQMYPPQIQTVVVPPFSSYQPRQTASQLYTPGPQYFPQAQIPASFGFPYYFPNSIIQSQHRANAVPTGIVQTASGPTLGPGATQAQIAIPSGGVLTSAGQTGTPSQAGTSGVRRKKRQHALEIINPETRKNVLEELELSKAQGASSSELDYQDQMTNEVLSSGTPQPQDQLGINTDQNCTNKPLQGMAYVDIMQQHKISAMSPCQTQVINQVNEMIGPTTPIVSAMSDAPSVEIHPKQQLSKPKKSKSIEIVAPPPPTEKSSEKSGHSETVNEEISEPASSLTDTTLTCSSTAKTVEEIPVNECKAIQKGDIETTNQSDTTGVDISIGQQEQSTVSSQPSITSSPTQVQSQSSSQQHQQPQQPQQQSQIQQTSHQQSQTSLSSSNNIKRDSKLSSNSSTSTSSISSTSSSTLPPLSLSSSSTTTTTTISSNSNVSTSTSNNISNSSSITSKTANSPSVASTVASSTSKQSSTISSSSSPNVTATTAKTKGKDKHHQQSAASSNTQNTGSSLPNAGTPTPSEVSNKESRSQNQNSVNNNNNNLQQQHHKQSEKMKLNEKDDKNSKANAASSTASNHNHSHADKKDTQSLNANTNSSKVSDKNDNVIPCKNYLISGSIVASDTNIKIAVTSDTSNNAANSNSTDNSGNTNSVQSHDETDKAATGKVDDNINCFNNNNNEKIKNSDSRRSNSPSIKSKTSNDEEDVPQKGAPKDAEHRNDVASNDNTSSNDSNGAIANGHATVSSAASSVKGDTTPTPQSDESDISPFNRGGIVTYNREQLLKLRDSQYSKEKPEINNKLLEYLIQPMRPPQSSLLPSFVLHNNKRQAMGSRNLSIGSMSGSSNANSFLKQSSMSGVNAKNSSKGSKSGMIHVSLSLREDVKLNETENAWRPTHLKQDDSKPPELAEKEELLRKVRGILNKLTPEKFDTLVDQIMKLQIDTPEKVNGVMELVFEKAVDEPNFSVSYARLCQNLGDIKINSADGQKPNFRSALIDKTENEFSHNVLNRQAKERKLQPILEKLKECKDIEKKLELQAMLEEEERKIRRRSGGTVRFIGELFKISMLTGNIINTCIENLLDPSSEDKLECLCKLLTTVGQKFEATPLQKGPKGRLYSLDPVIKKMQAIADRKVETKISSRVRFMLQDVIDLRKNKWTSTKTDLNPKTMEQIQKEAKTEQMSNQYLNYSLMSGKKDDRRYIGGSGSGSGGSSGGSMSFGSGSSAGNYFNKGNRQQQSDDNWYTQTSKGNRAVDTNKLMFNYDIDNDKTKLGGSYQFIWNTGARGATTTSNSFAALSSLDSNKGSNSGPRNKGSYNKGSMERDRYDGVNSRTGSAHGSRESSTSRNASQRGGSSNVQKSTSYQNYNTSNAPSAQRGAKTGATPTAPITKIQKPSAPPPAIFDEVTEKQGKAIMSALSEMLDLATEKSTDDCIQVLEKFPEGIRWAFLYYIFLEYLHLGKTKPSHRKTLAGIVLFLFNNNYVSIEHFKKGYQEFSVMAADLIIDVPELWHYIFQFAELLLSKKIITIKDLWNETLKSSKLGEKFLKEFLAYCSKEIGPEFTRNMWKNSNLKWTDFVEKDSVDKFIKENKFQYIESKDIKYPEVGANTETSKVMERIKELLESGTSTDAIIDYITGNIVDIDKAFIRGLTTTLCTYAIQYTNNNYKLNQERFRNVCTPLLQRYIDGDENRELECLFAIQILVHNLEHPSGLISDLFGELYDTDIIPQDSFLKWRDSKEEQTGKGVAAIALYSFFNNIESSETSDENN